MSYFIAFLYSPVPKFRCVFRAVAVAFFIVEADDRAAVTVICAAHANQPADHFSGFHLTPTKGAGFQLNLLALSFYPRHLFPLPIHDRA